MATGRITKRSVDLAAIGFLWDEELRGFGLKVTAAGAKSYVFQYRLGGRETTARRFTIGRHGSPWTPTSARAEAERLAILTKQGVDLRDAEVLRRRQAVDLAFDVYVDRFLALYVKAHWPGSYAFAEGILRLHVVPVLHRKPLPSITRSDIAAILDRLPGAKTALRRNVYAVIRRLLRWAVGRGDIERSPLEGFEAPPSAASRERVLSDKELFVVYGASESLGFPFGPLFRLLILTGQRRAEVAGICWSELDRPSKTWTLPPVRAKNGLTHVIPLSAAVVAQLDQLADNDAWPGTGLIFTTNGKTSVSGHSRAKSRLDASINELLAQSGSALSTLPPWRVHDLRRTVATGLQRIGTRFEVTEAILNHVSGARSGVAGVYQRHDWAEEKRCALDSWGEHVNTLLSSLTRSNVVPLKAA